MKLVITLGLLLGSLAADCAVNIKLKSEIPGFCELSLGKQISSKLKLVGKWARNPEEMGMVQYREYEVCDGKAHAVVALEEDRGATIEISNGNVCIDGKACLEDSFRAIQKKFPTGMPFMSQEEGRTLTIRLNGWVVVTFATDGIDEKCWGELEACSGQVNEAKAKSIYLNDYGLEK
jgi:hypothetical protein